MSDTNKCPKCGAAMAWRKDFGMCVECDYISGDAEYKRMDDRQAYQAALHRIRELEAQNARLRETVANKDNTIFSLSTELQYFKEKHQRVLTAYEGEVRRLREALKLYEEFEAALIADDLSWRTQSGHPFMTSELMDKFKACQDARNKALKS